MRTAGLGLALLSGAAFSFSSFSSYSAAAADSATGTVIVHVDSPSPVVLEKRASDKASWERVCESPCDVKAPVDAQYRITGTDISESKPFMLQTRGDMAMIKVTPGSHGKATAGWIVLGAGGAALIGGLILNLIGTGQNHIAGQGGPGDTATTDTDRANLFWVGSSLMVAGVVAGVYGGSLILNGAHSGVEGSVQSPPPAQGSNDGVTRVAASQTGRAPALMIPILRGTF